MDGVRAHRIAGNVVDRHEEKESERTKNDHPKGSAREESAWSYQRGVEGPEKEPIAPAVSMLTKHQPSFGNASPSLIFGYAN
jgi:hypothetical protein